MKKNKLVKNLYWIELEDGTRRKMTNEEKNNIKLIPLNSKIFFTSALASSAYATTCMYDFEFDGIKYKCGSKSWRTNREGMTRLNYAERLEHPVHMVCFVQYRNDFPVLNPWTIYEIIHMVPQI